MDGSLQIRMVEIYSVLVMRAGENAQGADEVTRGEEHVNMSVSDF